jgi:hypothetical protein
MHCPLQAINRKRGSWIGRWRDGELVNWRTGELASNELESWNKRNA